MNVKTGYSFWVSDIGNFFVKLMNFLANKDFLLSDFG